MALHILMLVFITHAPKFLNRLAKSVAGTSAEEKTTRAAGMRDEQGFLPLLLSLSRHRMGATVAKLERDRMREHLA